ncbi:hypothetical protein tf_37 [Pseudomonas phage tf]|jgi:hypothetical protein|uniref:Uncharacterized protein n=1 Tax=Pseudomonas phage tf TaxID=1114179 RepID=I2FLQ8_9CAUD|nr:hypothetical protein tf_37 [Pseudomonas phage tf]CCE60792.1 hypothetical protein tf_37 [Pseudomonas phage tf]
MNTINAYLEAKDGLNRLKDAAKAEFLGLTYRERCEALQNLDMTFLGHEGDGGFLYGAFPGGGWGKVVQKLGYERHQKVEVPEIIYSFFDAHYDEGELPEVTEENVYKAISEGDAEVCKLLRACLDRGIYSFEFDW